MSTSTIEFRIYVASLSDYNEGRLHGAWINLADLSYLEDLQEAVDDMLLRSPFGNSEFAKKNGLRAEEYAIHDYEGFPHGAIDENTSLSDVWDLWEEFQQAYEDDNVEAFLAYQEIFNDGYRQFADRFYGEYDSERDFAEEFLEETGDLSLIPENLRSYFDYEAYARDLFCSDFTMQNGYVFYNN